MKTVFINSLRRAVIIVCCLLLLAGHGACGWVVYDSQRPHRGANMVLMALPMIAGAMLIPALTVILLQRHRRDAPSFRICTLVLAWSGLLWCAVMSLPG